MFVHLMSDNLASENSIEDGIFYYGTSRVVRASEASDLGGERDSALLIALL